MYGEDSVTYRGYGGGTVMYRVYPNDIHPPRWNLHGRTIPNGCLNEVFSSVMQCRASIHLPYEESIHVLCKYNIAIASKLWASNYTSWLSTLKYTLSTPTEYNCCNVPLRSLPASASPASTSFLPQPLAKSSPDRQSSSRHGSSSNACKDRRPCLWPCPVPEPMLSNTYPTPIRSQPGMARMGLMRRALDPHNSRTLPQCQPHTTAEHKYCTPLGMKLESTRGIGRGGIASWTISTRTAGLGRPFRAEEGPLRHCICTDSAADFPNLLTTVIALVVIVCFFSLQVPPFNTMLRLLGLVLGTSVALAAPGTILPRRAFKWNCPPSECSNYLLQGTDTCYNYCVDGVCDVIAVDCVSEFPFGTTPSKKAALTEG